MTVVFARPASSASSASTRSPIAASRISSCRQRTRRDVSAIVLQGLVGSGGVSGFVPGRMRGVEGQPEEPRPRVRLLDEVDRVGDLPMGDVVGHDLERRGIRRRVLRVLEVAVARDLDAPRVAREAQRGRRSFEVDVRLVGGEVPLSDRRARGVPRSQALRQRGGHGIGMGIDDGAVAEAIGPCREGCARRPTARGRPGVPEHEPGFSQAVEVGRHLVFRRRRAHDLRAIAVVGPEELDADVVEDDEGDVRRLGQRNAQGRRPLPLRRSRNRSHSKQPRPESSPLADLRAATRPSGPDEYHGRRRSPVPRPARGRPRLPGASVVPRTAA
jgi:hypothetical protein